MLPSPGKCAQDPTSAFNQKWNDEDAAFLHTSALPLSKIPRGWERKQEVRKASQGRERKIWRRFNLRSRATMTPDEDDDGNNEEQHDSQSRPIKKLQQLSPQAMERTAATVKGTEHVFKATRWDRRKSVLPRKKPSRVEDSLVNTGQSGQLEEEQLSAAEKSQNYFAQAQTQGPVIQRADATDSEQDVNNHKLSTSKNSSVHADWNKQEKMYEREKVNEQEVAHDQENNGISFDSSTQELTVVNPPRSPTTIALENFLALPGQITYPKLSLSNIQPTELEGAAAAADSDLNYGGDVQVPSHGRTELDEESDSINADKTEKETSSSILQVPATGIEIAYPSLPISTEPSVPLAVPKVDGAEHADTKMSGLEEELVEASTRTNTSIECEKTFADVQATPVGSQVESLNAAPGREEPSDLVMDDKATEEPAMRHSLAALRTKTTETVSSEEGSDMQTTDKVVRPISPLLQNSPIQRPDDDIADGLTLSFSPTARLSIESVSRKLHSPPPPQRPESGQDDMTMTLAIDDDTAVLKSFLSRAAASKAVKAAVITHRRESQQNRRDSDVVRRALASPRSVLKNKDTNPPSHHNNTSPNRSQTPTAVDNALESPTDEEQPSYSPRRSSRTTRSRTPTSASATQASKIAIRRADGNEVILFKKNNAQELTSLTRINTRKNKQGALGAAARLLKPATDPSSLPLIDNSTKEAEFKKRVRWDEQLTYYRENSEALAEAESLATPDELGLPDPIPAPKIESKSTKNSTPKIRRVRGLGTANGTPGKGLLTPAALLPETVQKEQSVDVALQPSASARPTRMKKISVVSTSTDGGFPSISISSRLPALDVAPVGVQPRGARKSRLVAPKKVTLPQPVTSTTLEGKEDAQRLGIHDATPRKAIPAPKVVVPSMVGMESGLPRRRTRTML